MFRTIATIVLLLLAGQVGSGQSPKIPPQLSMLLDRARDFRTALAAGDLVRAQEYVLAEARNRVLGGQGQMFRDPQVLGLDLGEDPSRVGVRVSLRVLTQGADTAGRFVVRDGWIHTEGEWFFDAPGFRDVWELEGLVAEIDTEALKSQLDGEFELLEDQVDVGRLIRGEHRSVRVPIRYSGDAPARIETTLPSELLTLDAVSTRVINSDSGDFVLLLSADNDWEGVFDIPLPLEIHARGVSIKRTLRVKGNVFAPLDLERSTEALGDPAEYRFIIVNNSEETMRVAYMSVDGKMDILGHSEEIEPGGEGFVHLRSIPDQTLADRLTIVLKEPLFDRQNYVFRLRLQPAP